MRRIFAVILIVVPILFWSLRSERQRLTVLDWPSDLASADSLARSLERLIGRAPSQLAGCGRSHLLIGYIDTPGDLRPEYVGSTPTHTLAQQTRFTVASTIAAVAWTYFRIDTITVRLMRTKHMRSNETDRAGFSFAQRPDIGRPREPSWLGAVTATCPPGT